MRKHLTAVLLALCCLPAAAQLSGTGFYRFRNADRQAEYISLANDKFNYTTCISTACGGLRQALTDGGKARGLECAGRYLETDIHMVEDADCINVGSVVYADKKNNNPRDYDYNLIAQGTSLLTLTTGTYPGSYKLEFKDRYVTIDAVEGTGGAPLYTAKIELKSSTSVILYGQPSLGIRYLVDDGGTLAINEENTLQSAWWYVEPVEYFNVRPEVEYGGKFYTTMYASFADIQSEMIDLSECKIIWWHYHKDGGVDGHDAFVANAPEALAAKNQLRTFYENGGSMFLTRYATNLPSFIGVTGDDEWTTPNNCWGQNEDGAELCGGPWEFSMFAGQNGHPLWQGIIQGDDPNRVYCTDAGYHITNSTAQYHIGTDWGGYDNHAAWEARTGGKILGVGGDGAVVAWEYPARDGRGGIICIGSGCYDWYSYTYEAGYVENFHKNIAIITKNAINYLTK